MSMSIHTPPLVRGDTSGLDQPTVSNNKLIVKPNAQTPGATVLQTSLRLDDTQGLRNTALTPETALRQLFDMLEGIFRTMRDIFSGKTTIKPDPDKQPVAPDTKELVKPDAGKLPVLPDAPKELIKPDAGKLPVLPDAPKELIKPDAGKLPVLPVAPKELIKPDAGKLPVLPDARKELVKPDAGKLPVLPDSRKELVKPDAATVRVLPQPADVSVIVPDGNKPRPSPFPPTVPKPEISVNNDPKTNVQVNVVLNHCHCPDGKVSPDRLPIPRVSTDTRPQPPILPDAQPQPAVFPGNIPRPNVPMDIKPQPQVLPDTKPTPLPDTPAPDLTSPGPVDAGRHGRFNHRLSSRF
ncbi:hypothetical protein [Pseudomonas sp. R3-18-08]|uniref:hypothetical protein n=1 Tax=Pseudomonas sp. R3-18-08 TaxID=1173283 RepID=UPI000F565439|nr:hypothetical protein [Pseudomonas sp. R3-18-08]AZF16955.1 hypothetical protein C4J92_3483 [Pseudomonas sp. R3-18-08]